MTARPRLGGRVWCTLQNGERRWGYLLSVPAADGSCVVWTHAYGTVRAVAVEPI